MVICQLNSYKSVLFVVRVALKYTVNKTVLKLSYWWMLYFCKKKTNKASAEYKVMFVVGVYVVDYFVYLQ